MTNPSDQQAVRAAAEQTPIDPDSMRMTAMRCARHPDAVWSGTPNKRGVYRVWGLREEAQKLGEEWLREHGPSDDAEGVTPDWLADLLGVPATWHEYFSVTVTTHHDARCVVSIFSLRHGPNAGRWEISVNGCPWMLARDRGHVREVFRALGVELKGDQS